MEISISELNSLCGVDCAMYLTDYANVFNRRYEPSISCSTVHDVHSEFFENSTQSKIRFRGIGHSMHGRSLPCSEEKLISTCNMNIVKVLDEYTLEVDCGVQVGALNDFLNQYYCRLPVIHSGGHGGPSVAGYFLAGGIGDQSSIFGGFWSNVEEILWTDFSEKKSCWYTQSDPRFWEISGSGGRLAGFLGTNRFVISHASLQKIPTCLMYYKSQRSKSQSYGGQFSFAVIGVNDKLMRTLAPRLILLSVLSLQGKFLSKK